MMYDKRTEDLTSPGTTFYLCGQAQTQAHSNRTWTCSQSGDLAASALQPALPTGMRRQPSPLVHHSRGPTTGLDSVRCLRSRTYASRQIACAQPTLRLSPLHMQASRARRRARRVACRHPAPPLRNELSPRLSGARAMRHSAAHKQSTSLRGVDRLLAVTVDSP